MKRNWDFSVYLVTDAALSLGRPVDEVVRAAVKGGVTVVQVREKSASARAALREIEELRAFLHDRNVPLVVNDRLDWALACGADGVHLGQDDLPCAEARRIAGPDLVIGVSVRTPEETRAAERDGADYVAVSPVWSTPTKRDAPAPAGLEGIRAVRAATRLPVVAIGGVHAGNAGAVIRAGASGVAVVSAIMSASDPAAAARDLRRKVREAQSAHPLLAGDDPS
ncbi:MAG: thiamine phosphate synthase [Kiritimatiellae bacterium]|nr:thiamine phosphate synthase [Kiritimatiellia bacterium]